MPVQSIIDRIKGVDDRVIEPVKVPEWDDMTVWVRSLTAAEKDAFEKKVFISDGEGNRKRELYRTSFVIACTCDADGNLIFSDDDAEWLSQKSAVALDRIIEVVTRINRTTKEDEDVLLGN